MMKNLIITSLLMVPGAAMAQDLDRAIDDFNTGIYTEAIAGFYEVLKYGENRGDRNDAKYYMARAMLKEQMVYSARTFLREIILDGPRNRHYVAAIGYLLEAGELLQDDYDIPKLINREYGDAFRDLRDVVLNRVNFLIGNVLYRDGKQDQALQFLDPEKGVPSGAPDAPASRYLVGLIHMRRGDVERGIKYFGQALEEANKVTEKKATETTQRVYRQVVLGLARAWYEVGTKLAEDDPERGTALRKSATYFRMVPRFTEDWSDAIFERGWVHFQLNEYGKSLGQMHSLTAPYFGNSRQYAEGFILKMIAYFYNCQFDRVRRSLSEFKAVYDPVVEDLTKFLASKPADESTAWYYDQLLATLGGGDVGIPSLVAGSVAGNNRYQRLSHFLGALEKEQERIKSIDLFKGELAGELRTAIEEDRERLVPFMGKLVRAKLQRQLEVVKGMSSQADIIDIQTGLAEAKWLDQQREIDSKVRKRLPRPFVPSDKFQYWPFHGEYWLDELGFYEYAVKSECVE
jgi:tetratricopeptide (TPR) repeat protein